MLPWRPNACCCASCTLFSDDFSTDQLATEYNQVSGSWSVGSGVLTTTSAGAILRCETASATGHGRALVTAKATTSGATFRLIGSYVDTNNYLFCEVTLSGGSSTFKLWKRVAGLNTQISSTVTLSLTTNQFYDMALCWSGTYAIAVLSMSGVISRSSVHAKS